MNIAIIGATSAIAQACAREWAERGEQLVLVARDWTRLRRTCAFAQRGAQANVRS
jgi:decaprenylphospho-beta-D-erythro-pentofuranosid-2-ulose 2-reductase